MKQLRVSAGYGAWPEASTELYLFPEQEEARVELIDPEDVDQS